MKLTFKTSTSTLIIGITIVSCIAFWNCKQDLFVPGGNVPVPEQYADFSTRSDVIVNLDYQTPGSKTLVSLYSEDPLENLPGGTTGLKQGIQPLFMTFTDDNGKFSGTVTLPTAVSQVFIYTPTLGLPRCITVNVTSTGINFKLSDIYVQDVATTKAVINSPSGSILPYTLDATAGLYSLCKWRNYGKPNNSTGYITDVSASVTGTWISSIQSTLWNGNYYKPGGLDNSKFLVSEQYTNISIATQITQPNGTVVPVTGANIYLTFMDEAGWYQNALAYYYYPTGQKPTNPSQLKKYIIFPNASTGGSVPFNGSAYNNAPLNRSSKVTLKYFDSNGQESDLFPPGYTIGWLLISDAYNGNNLSTDHDFYYSNESWNNGKKHCIALNDAATNRVIIGFEDNGDASCEDVLFFVDATPQAAIIDPNKPSINPGGTVTIPDQTVHFTGTYAFEDMWPSKGDYDMNDVVIEYDQAVTFDQNNYVKKIVDTFKPTQEVTSASYLNAFAYQIDANQVGSYGTLPAGVTYEPDTHSFIVFPNTTLGIGKTVTITRTFSTPYLKANLKKYNPFIIPRYIVGSKKRGEVHLPKYQATSYADASLALTKDDAYYIDRDGKYPFSIDIPIQSFKIVKEGVKIGSTNEYPNFTKWAESKCTNNLDWYTKKN